MTTKFAIPYTSPPILVDYRELTNDEVDWHLYELEQGDLTDDENAYRYDLLLALARERARLRDH